ncbi:AAEL012923-PA [Aedes aegypti]|uniref:Protein aurora borealis n=1 Tax=Aedes aegypti TaxID=7159 RepID=Q16KN8_AEDAE|nr:AAEL012923-PA [Aedes aegypti]
MDQEAFLTPRKISQNAFNAAGKSTARAHSPSFKPYSPKSPKSLSRSSAGTSRINLLPVIRTPPSRMLKGKVINPFKAHLTDRIPLPVFDSPTFFQRPSIPQTGSVTQFEWCLDGVSYLGPANVEAHETEFLTAIDSFMGRKFKQKRDGVAQTVLTFPSILPKEVEDKLASCFSFHYNQQQEHEVEQQEHEVEQQEPDVIIHHDPRDALRRKLFNCSADSTVSETPDQDDALDHLDMHSLSPAPVSPDVNEKCVQNLKRSRCFGSQEIEIDPDNISLSSVVDNDTESFGALSPISKISTSPSPLKRSTNSTTHDAILRSTPEKQTDLTVDFTEEDQLSSLVSQYLTTPEKQTDLTVDFTEEDQLSSLASQYLTTPEEQTDLTVDFTEEDQLSSLVSQYPTTPLRHTSRERRPNRKNLSRSFLLYSEEDRFEEEQQLSKEFHQRSFVDISRDKENIDNAKGIRRLAKSDSETSSGKNVYRMDIGFNEEETRTNQETNVAMQSEYCEGDQQTPQRFEITKCPPGPILTVQPPSPRVAR